MAPDRAEPNVPRRRLWSVVRATIAGHGLAVVFVLALVAGVALHLNLGPLRRVVVARVTALLEPIFAGKIAIDSIGKLDFEGFEEGSVRILDPSGKVIATAHGVRARIALGELFRSLHAGSGPIVIHLSGVAVQALDFALDVGDDGKLAIERTFVTRAPPSNGPPGRAVKLTIDSIDVAHAWVHGLPAKGFPVDADLDSLRAQLGVDGPRVAIDVPSFSLLTRSFPFARATAEVHVALPAPSGGAVGVKVGLSGAIGGIPATIQASLDGDTIDAIVDAPTIAPDALRALWPASPIDRPAAAHVDLHGALPRLQAHAHVTQGEASFDVTGPVVIGPAQTADLHFDARAIDLHGVVSSAPVSKLGASGEVSLARTAGGALSGKGAIDFAGGNLNGASIPSGKINATFSQEAGAAVHADATVAAHEPGAPTVLKLHLAPKGRSYELTFDGDTHVPRLESVPRFRSVASGQTEVKTHGVIDLDRGALDVKVSAEVIDLGHDVLTVKHASVAAQVRGSLAAPQIDLSLHGDLLDFGGYRFSGAQLEVHGPASHADVHTWLDADGDGTPDFEADGELSIGSVTKIDRIKVFIARAREDVTVHVGQIVISHGELSIAPIEIDGLGGPITGSFHSTFAGAHVDVKGERVDLARFGRVSRVKEGLSGCLATIDVDLTARRDGGDGHASLELGKCSLDLGRADATSSRVEGISLGLQATLKGRQIAGRAHAELEDVGEVVLTAPKITIGGTGTLIQSLKETFGRVKFDGKLDLTKLAARFPRESKQLDQIRGMVTLQGSVDRDSPTDDTPGLTLSVSTSGLALRGPTTRTTGLDGSAIITPPAWAVDGIDLGLDARIDGDNGFAALALHLNDAKGALLALDLKSGAVPYTAIIDHPERALALLETVQFNAHVGIPRRDVNDLPAILAQKGVHGTIEADANATGTLLAPMVDVRAKVGKGRMQQGVSFPIDLDLTAHYFGKHATLALAGTEESESAPGDREPPRGEREVIDARFDAEVDAADLVHGNTSTWKGSGRAHLDALELASLAPLSDRQVSGTVTGDLTVDGIHQDGHAKFSIDIGALKVGQVAYRSGSVKATIDGKAFDATLHLEQDRASSSSPAGSIDATAQAGSRWGTAIFPSLDPSRPATGELHARAFRAGLLLPFLDNSFTELDGKMDADVKLAADATGRPQAQGTLALTEGRFELASIGGEFHDVTAKVLLTPDGVVKIDGVSASAMSGRIQAAATVRLNGIALVGANATFQIPRSTPLLLTVEGAQVGTVDGNVDLNVNDVGKAIDVKVKIPRLHVELPLTSSRDVQALGEMAGVRIGVDKGNAGFIAQRLDAPREQVAAPAGKTITIAIALGNDVVVKKSTDLNVSLGGTPVITIGETVRAGGQVRLLSGKIDVQGKSFDIDSGTVTFNGDPTDPQVVVTASWTAADGTRVFAELRGTLKKPVVTLRSEPSFPKDQIIALLLYGSADATSPNSGAAAGVAGGTATQPLNRALENMGLGGVSTRVDTSAVTPRADVEVQIARNLSLQIAQLMGAPPPGSNPDTTLFTLSWRFARAWSAQTTIGDQGTTILDLIWQHRY